MQTRHHPLLTQSLGTQREIVSFHYGTPGEGPKAYIQASLHADELPGMLVAQHLRRHLATLESAGHLRGEVVVVPVANPIGLSQWLLREPIGRFDAATGQNFNRHYPGLTDAVWSRVESSLGADPDENVRLIRSALREQVALLPAASELESLRRTLLRLACDADIVLDLHCDTEAVLHMYTGTPLWPQAEVLARYLGAEVSLLASDSGDQPFDEASSQLWWTLAERAGSTRPVPAACLAATLELRGSRDVSDALATRDAVALVNFLAHRRLLAIDVVPPPATTPISLPLAGSEPLEAPSSGLVVWMKSPGQWVKKGEPIAQLIDPINDEAVWLRSPTDGLLYARESRRFATAGMRLAKIAGERATRTGKLMSP
jgi:predicted deacylase